MHRAVLEKVATSALAARLRVRGLVPSPIKGPSGNLEFFLHLSKDEQLEDIAIEQAVRVALSEAETL